MSDENLSISLDLDAGPSDVYRALTTADGIAGWWTADCEMDAREGGRALFRFPGAGFYVEVEIVRLVPDRRVVWRCVAQEHPEASGFANRHDWVGTTMRFEIEERAPGRSRLEFVHEGLLPLECAEVCTSGWQHYVPVSLRALVETGAGEPFVPRT